MEKISASSEVKEFLKRIASMGGKSRSQKLTYARRKEIAAMGGRAKRK